MEGEIGTSLETISTTETSSTTKAEEGEIGHYLVTNQRNKKGRATDLGCFLCHASTIKYWKTIYGCVKCKKAFHVDCFTAYHHRKDMVGSTKLLLDYVQDSNPTALNVNKKVLKLVLWPALQLEIKPFKFIRVVVTLIVIRI